jgi:hypothetical protein
MQNEKCLKIRPFPLVRLLRPDNSDGDSGDRIEGTRATAVTAMTGEPIGPGRASTHPI